MSTLKVEHISRQDGRTLVYRLRGVLGESTYSYEFLEELRQQLREGADCVVLNLEGLEYITSTGVGVIAAAYTSAQRQEKRFALVAVPAKVQRVLDLCGVFTLVEHFATEDDAATPSGD